MDAMVMILVTGLRQNVTLTLLAGILWGYSVILIFLILGALLRFHRCRQLLRHAYVIFRAFLLDVTRLDVMKHWGIFGAKALILGALFLGVIPLMRGLLIELAINIPLRIPLEQSPIFDIWKIWSNGVCYTIFYYAYRWSLVPTLIIVATELNRPRNFQFVIKCFVAPMVIYLGKNLAGYCILVHGVVPLIVSNVWIQTIIARLYFPIILHMYMFRKVQLTINLIVPKFMRLYDKRRDRKYLLRLEVINYEPTRNL